MKNPGFFLVGTNEVMSAFDYKDIANMQDLETFSDSAEKNPNKKNGVVHILVLAKNEPTKKVPKMADQKQCIERCKCFSLGLNLHSIFIMLLEKGYEVNMHFASLKSYSCETASAFMEDFMPDTR